MSTENPFQSPQVNSELHSDDPSIASPGPTWRFVLLALVGSPAVIAPMFIVWANFRGGGLHARLFLELAITTLLLFAYVGSCISIAVYWNAPLRKRMMRPGARLVQVAIWVLALLAVPSAFVSTCYPIGIGTAMATYPNGYAVIGGIILGIVVGVICVILTGWLARNLWLDVFGRTKKPRISQDDPKAD